MFSEPEISPSLIINIDQTPLSYVNIGKYTFSFKGDVFIKDVDDKGQINSHFCCQLHWRFFANPANLCRENRTKSTQVFFSAFFFGNVHRKSLVKHRAIFAFFKEIIFPYLEDTKRSKTYPLELDALIIMDSLKGPDNNTLKKLCAECNCDVVIVHHNLTNKFQPLHFLSVNKVAKSFIQNKCYVDQVFT